MDSDMPHAHGHHYNENPLHPVGGEEEVHHEKTSVLKKVKAKARKIKDQLGLKSHTHTHDQSESSQDHDEEEESDDAEEQLVQNPQNQVHESAEAKNFAAGQEGSAGQSKVHLDEKSPHFSDNQDQNVCPGTFQTKITDPVHNSPTGHDINSGQSNANAPKHRGGEDVSPANYQTKVTDTDTGAGGREEPGVAPILHSFDKMNIHDEPRHKKESTSTESHDQFTPSPSPSFDSNKSTTIPENAPSVPKSFNASTENHPQDAPSVPESFNASTENHPQDMNVDEPTTHQSGYTDRISSVTTALASKIGYGGNDGNASAGMQKDNGGENVTSAGKPIASTDDLNAANPSKQQNTYTEKFSSVTYAMADKAVSAKNVVASKLGYGGSENTAAVGSEVNKGEDNVKTGGGVTGYGRQIASTVTEKLAPVYGTVAEVGSAVLSKIPGTTAPTETERGVVGETDKGVGSKKGYLEKLKPGEEDKALSQVISDALHKRKGGEERKEKKRPVGEVVSDAFHKRNDEEDMPRDDKPMGKVTESEEVANRLGSSESERLGKVSGSESPGKGVVDKFKGAFTNWFGKGGETNPSQAFNDHSPSHGTKEEQGMAREGGENVSSEGERKLQESSN